MITRFVALGDSFTEGLDDQLRSDGRHMGWADRVSRQLPLRQRIDSVQYANLAIRGRLTRQVIEEQVPAAVELRPDMTSIAVGVNDVLRRDFDLDTVATDLERAVRALRTHGSDVTIFAFGDPTRRSQVLGSIAGRIQGLRTATLAIAQAYGCSLVDFWGAARFDDERLWSADRLHLSSQGHAVTAEAVLDTWGLGDSSWRAPDSDPPRNRWVNRRVADGRWLGAHALPWLGRRVRRVSSGFGVQPKDPVLRTIHNPRASSPQVAGALFD